MAVGAESRHFVMKLVCLGMIRLVVTKVISVGLYCGQRQ